ncbi:MAG: family PEP-CTERM/XrtA system glycosyltransferase, partial [Sphingomonas bacterium]|nr:family PEP-CTERM/XrtA system glycosyltransferase [Sphingomonas bacterium]
DDDADLAHAEALRPLVGRLHVEKRTRSKPRAAIAALVGGRAISVAMFDSPHFGAAVARLVRDEPIDTIFAFSGQMAQFVAPDPERRFVMDFVDVDSAKFDAYAEDATGLSRWLYAREARRLGAFERDVAARADLSLFVSAQEAGLFRDRTGLPATSCAVLENGVDLERYAPTASFTRLAPDERGEGPLIVFTGQMNYRPNAAAAQAFATEMLPAIRARHPSARFAIVGRAPEGALRRLDGRAGVRVTGAVPDVRGWLAAADIVVAPLSIARGVQNKVLEAMAMGRPVVASPAAFEGIDASVGTELLVAGADSMAAVVADLLDDPVRRRALGKAARALVERRYAWAARLAPLAAMVGRANPAPRGVAQ